MTPSWSRPLGASLAHKLPDHRSAAAATTTWGAHLALTAAASKQLNALHQALQAMKGELSVAKDTIADLQAELAVLNAALPGATGASGSSAPTATPSDASGDMTDATPIVDQDQSAEAVVPTKKSGKDVLHVLAACHGGQHSHSSNDGPLLLLAAGARNACEPSILIAGLSNAVLRIPVSGMRLSTSDFNCSSLSSRSGKGVLALAPRFASSGRLQSVALSTLDSLSLCSPPCSTSSRRSTISSVGRFFSSSSSSSVGGFFFSSSSSSSGAFSSSGYGSSSIHTARGRFEALLRQAAAASGMQVFVIAPRAPQALLGFGPKTNGYRGNLTVEVTAVGGGIDSHPIDVEDDALTETPAAAATPANATRRNTRRRRPLRRLLSGTGSLVVGGLLAVAGGVSLLQAHAMRKEARETGKQRSLSMADALVQGKVRYARVVLKGVQNL
jgi:hypothetical protein